MNSGDGIRSRVRNGASRGRPPKFGRPSAVIALTLPRDVLDRLRVLHSDPGWAIVQLVESLVGRARTPSKTHTDVAELVHLPGRRALIVVDPRVFKRLRGVSLIPLADGRAFLAFDERAGLADLEVAILDRLEEKPSEREPLAQMRDIVRGWRRNRRMVFRTKSIIVVDASSDVIPQPLARLRGKRVAPNGRRKPFRR